MIGGSKRMFPLPNAGTDVEIRLINIICSEVAAESYLKNTVCMFIFAIVAAIFMGLTAVHQNGEVMDYLHKYGQRKAMKEQGWSTEDFMKVFGANYL